MNQIEFLAMAMRIQELLKKMGENPKKKSLVEPIMFAFNNILLHGLDYADNGDNFIASFVGNKKGKEPVVISFSMLDLHNDNTSEKLLRDLDEQYQGIFEELICSVADEIAHTLQQELKKIAEDVIGEEESGGVDDGVMFVQGYNNKRQELITYFQDKGVI
jgi:uncharacterized UPF0160 family protein